MYVKQTNTTELSTYSQMELIFIVFSSYFYGMLTVGNK